MHKGMKKVDPIVTNKKIIRFEIINGELRPIYET